MIKNNTIKLELSLFPSFSIRKFPQEALSRPWLEPDQAALLTEPAQMLLSTNRQELLATVPGTCTSQIPVIIQFGK